MRCAWLSVILALAACEKPSRPAAPRPPNLVADITRGSRHAIDGLKAYAGAVKPMLAAFDEDALLTMTKSAFGLAKLDGLDRDHALHVLVIDDGKTRSYVLVGKVADGAKLDASKDGATIETGDDWAVIGRDATVVHELAPYALSVLATESPAAKPVVTLYLDKLLDRHADDVAKLRALFVSTNKQLIATSLDSVIAIAHEIGEVRATIDADATRADLELEVMPKAGSQLVAFATAQQPSDFHLMDALPDGDAIALLAGRVVAGPYHDGLAKLITRMYNVPQLSEVYDTLMRASSGELAMSMRLGTGMVVTQITALDDVAAAQTALDRTQQLLAAGLTITIDQMQATYSALPENSEHDGATLRHMAMTYDLSSTTPAQRAALSRLAPDGKQLSEIGIVDHDLVVAMGGDPEASAFAMIDAIHRKRPATTWSPAIAKLIDAARARKDSLVIAVDVAKLRLGGEPAPALLSIGSETGNLRLHAVLPVATAHALGM